MFKRLCIKLSTLVFLAGCTAKLGFNLTGSIGENSLDLSDDTFALSINSTSNIDVFSNDESTGLELSSISVVSGVPEVTLQIVNTTEIQAISTGDYQGDVVIEYEAVNSEGLSGTARLTVNVGYCSGDRLTDTPYANSSLGTDGLSAPQAFTICSFEQLNRIGLDTLNLDKFFELRYDIDFSGVSFDDFNTIGDGGNDFMGDFNGLGHSIRNINWSEDLGIATTSSVYLFASAVGATISNLVVENMQVTWTTGSLTVTSGLVGLAQNSTLNNIEVSAQFTVLSGNVFIFGGVAGFLVNSSATNCSANLELEASGQLNSVGGVIGSASSSGLSDLTAVVDFITGTEGNNLGGLVGELIGLNTLEDSYSTGSISAASVLNLTGLGGLVGRSITSTISDSFSTASVSAAAPANQIGGLLGRDGGITTINNSFYGTFPNSCVNLAGVCSALGTAEDISAGTGDPTYFLGNSANPPLNTWDFVNDWSLVPGQLPDLQL